MTPGTRTGVATLRNDDERQAVLPNARFRLFPRAIDGLGRTAGETVAVRGVATPVRVPWLRPSLRCPFSSCLPAFLSGVLLTLALPPPASADLADDSGLGPQAAALGGAATAVPVGAMSLHYSPALLAPRDMRPGLAELSLGYVYGQPLLYVHGDGGLDLATPTPRETSSLVVGGRFDLFHGLGLDGVVGAIAISTPVTRLFSYSVRPDDDVQWMTLTDGASHLSILAGVGVRPVEWLSLGFALRVELAIELYTTALTQRIDMRTDPETGAPVIDLGSSLGATGRVSPRVVPIASVAVTPIPELRVGLTYRAASFVDDWGWSRIEDIPDLGAIGYIHRFAHWVRPHELVLGVAAQVHPMVELSADLGWEHWSEATTPNHDPARGRFGDILVPAAGVRVTPVPGLDLLFGYRYVRAPYSNFGGPANLLINDTHHASLGGAAALGTLTGERDLPLTIRGSFRLSILEEARETKDFRRFDDDASWRASPGYPGYVFGGVVPSLQLSVEIAW